MAEFDYIKKLVGAIVGAAVTVPSIAAGFYFAYQAVTLIGN